MELCAFVLFILGIFLAYITYNLHDTEVNVKVNNKYQIDNCLIVLLHILSLLCFSVAALVFLINITYKIENFPVQNVATVATVAGICGACSIYVYSVSIKILFYDNAEIGIIMHKLLCEFEYCQTLKQKEQWLNLVRKDLIKLKQKNTLLYKHVDYMLKNGADTYTKENIEKLTHSLAVLAGDEKANCTLAIQK